jgi:hypothetical protein
MTAIFPPNAIWESTVGKREVENMQSLRPETQTFHDGSWKGKLSVLSSIYIGQRAWSG